MQVTSIRAETQLVAIPGVAVGIVHISHRSAEFKILHFVGQVLRSLKNFLPDIVQLLVRREQTVKGKTSNR